MAAREWQRLTDGCLGDERIFHGFEWTQFTETQTDLVVDLEQIQTVSRLRLNFEAGAHRQLFSPSAVTVLASTDGQDWQPWAESAPSDDGRLCLERAPQSIRYLRLQISNTDQHYGPEQRRHITRPVHLDELVID